MKIILATVLLGLLGRSGALVNYFIGLGGPTHYAVVGNAPWGWAVMSHPTAVRDGKQIFTTLHVLSLRQSDIRVQCNTYTIAFQKERC